MRDHDSEVASEVDDPDWEDNGHEILVPIACGWEVKDGEESDDRGNHDWHDWVKEKVELENLLPGSYEEIGDYRKDHSDDNDSQQNNYSEIRVVAEVNQDVGIKRTNDNERCKVQQMQNSTLLFANFYLYFLLQPSFDFWQFFISNLLGRNHNDGNLLYFVWVGLGLRDRSIFYYNFHSKSNYYNFQEIVEDFNEVLRFQLFLMPSFAKMPLISTFSWYLYQVRLDFN